MTCDTNIPINKRMDLASDQVELKKKKAIFVYILNPIGQYAICMTGRRGFDIL